MLYSYNCRTEINCSYICIGGTNMRWKCKNKTLQDIRLECPQTSFRDVLGVKVTESLALHPPNGRGHNFFPFLLGTFPYGLCKKDIPIIYTLCTFFESWCKHYFFVHSRILFTTLAHFLWTAADSERLLSWKASIQIEWQRLHCLQNRPLISVLIQATLWLLDGKHLWPKDQNERKVLQFFQSKKKWDLCF